MSFKINWGAIEGDSMRNYTRELLEEALNTGDRPTVLCEGIEITGLEFGTIPPSFQILEIGDLGVDRFRGIFSFKYYGDASVTVKTGISASVLKNYNVSLKPKFIRPHFVVSDCDFNVPLDLTLAKIRMSSIIIVVFSKTKGLTLVFKNDPLESIEVKSSFDTIRPIANFLQKKIESQIGELFREFLPSLLYKFSLKYTAQSFDQFHKDLLHDQTEDVQFKDIDPEHSFRVAPGSLMRLTRLASSRDTLGITHDVNTGILSKGLLSNIKRVNPGPQKMELPPEGGIDKLAAIKEFQTKQNKGKIHRRVIKMSSTPPPYNKDDTNAPPKNSSSVPDPLPNNKYGRHTRG